MEIKKKSPNATTTAQKFVGPADIPAVSMNTNLHELFHLPEI